MPQVGSCAQRQQARSRVDLGSPLLDMFMLKAYIASRGRARFELVAWPSMGKPLAPAAPTQAAMVVRAPVTREEGMQERRAREARVEKWLPLAASSRAGAMRLAWPSAPSPSSKPSSCTSRSWVGGYGACVFSSGHTSPKLELDRRDTAAAMHTQLCVLRTRSTMACGRRSLAAHCAPLDPPRRRVGRSFFLEQPWAA